MCRPGSGDCPHHPLHQRGEVIATAAATAATAAAMLLRCRRRVLRRHHLRHVAAEKAPFQRRHPLRREEVHPELFDEYPAAVAAASDYQRWGRARMHAGRQAAESKQERSLLGPGVLAHREASADDEQREGEERG